MTKERREWANALLEAAKLAGLWEPDLSVAKLAKRIETRIGKAYGDRQLTRWLTADPKASTPDADVQKIVLDLLAPPAARPALRDLPTFETDAERRAATLTILYFAQQLGPQLVETVDRAVQTLLVPIGAAQVAEVSRASANVAKAVPAAAKKGRRATP